MKAKSGFTLVEILIVVVILGILAAIVIPQFTGASTEAKESSLVSDLQTIRSSIELYKIQHNADIVPGEIVNADGSITASDEALFVTAFCNKTDKDGNVGTTVGVHVFGPYAKKMPPNPFSSASGTTESTGLADDAAMVASGATKLAAGGSASGWYIVLNRDAATGQALADHGLFQAADGLSHPTEGIAHVDY